MTRPKRPVIPELIENVSGLNQLRDKTYAALAENEFKKKDLSKAINDMSFFREHMASIRPKKAKKQKYGTVGMDDLVKIVATLKQDVKQIKDAQSVQSANEWIERHKLSDIYEATGRDLDHDNIPEVVVQTKVGKKPVIVNGYTTVPSLFPYRNAYYTTYPSYEGRVEAHKQGINLRSYIDDIYNPEYDESGRKVTRYTGKEWKEWEADLKRAGIKESQLIKPKGRSTYQSFVSRCISPIYQAIKYLNGVKPPFSLTDMASVIWNQFILIPAMVYVYGSGIRSVSDEQWKNLRGKKDVKLAIEYSVHEYLINPVKIGDLVPTACEMCNKANMPVEPEHIPLVAKVTVAIILVGLQSLPADPSEFEAWFNENVQPQLQAANAIESQATPAIVQDIDENED